jgi:hypothetical protein
MCYNQTMNTILNFAQSTYDYTTTTSTVDAGVIAGLMVVYILTFVVAYVVTAIFLGKIFKKAGVPSYIAWVPFYNSWKLLEIGGQQGFWAILAILPIVSIVSLVFTIMAIYNIGLKLGKSGAFVALAIFLPIVWMIWLAVDKSVWNESLGAPSKAAEHIGLSPVAATPYAQPGQTTPTAPVEMPTFTPPAPEAPVTPPTDQTPPTPPTAPTV